MYACEAFGSGARKLHVPHAILLFNRMSRGSMQVDVESQANDRLEHANGKAFTYPVRQMHSSLSKDAQVRFPKFCRGTAVIRGSRCLLWALTKCPRSICCHVKQMDVRAELKRLRGQEG